jgi:peptide/nickel transport system ATP-binding protein
MSAVLEVIDLSTHFFTRAGVVKAVEGVGFTLNAGEILGLVGESGSGKSMTGYSIMGLIDAPGRVVAGSIKLKGEDLTGYDEARWQKVRGNRIAMIFQDPMMTLNPVLRIDTQMIEAVLAHHDLSRDEALARSREALVKVGIPSPDERLVAYPHLLNKPDVIIADEPTTALDVTIQGQILFEMQKLCRESGTALIWITHDLSVIAGLADQVAVMYAGRIVETGTVDDVLDRSRHPYTRGLMGSVPACNLRGQRLKQIAGMTPSLLSLGAGCAFRERCDRATEQCGEMPALSGNAHAVRCHHPHGANP